MLSSLSPEPKKKIAIRFYKVDGDEGRVEVYYKDKIIEYKRVKKDEAGNATDKEKLELIKEYINFFDEVPIVAFYFGDEMIGLISPVISLLDAYDVLVSDSMNEFDRFAFAYLIMKKFGLSDQVNKKMYLINHAVAFFPFPSWGTEWELSNQVDVGEARGDAPEDTKLTFHPEAYKMITQFLDSEGMMDIEEYIISTQKPNLDMDNLRLSKSRG